MSTLLMGPDTQFQAIDLQISPADTIGNVAQFVVAPMDGYWDSIDTVVQATITTGGTITASNIGQATQGNDMAIVAPVGVTPSNVAGMVATIPNAAAVGSVVTAKATAGDATQLVKKGQACKLILAGFATAGAVNVTIRWRSEPLGTLFPLSG